MHRHLYRAPRLVEYPVSKDVDFEVGDLMWWDASAGYAKPLADFTWDTNEETTRRNALSQFIGVAMERRTGKEGNDSTMVVPSGCVFEFALTSATPTIGTLLGFEKATGNNLESQKLQVVTDLADAVGYCVKRYTSATTTVQCVLFSPYDVEGGLQSRADFLTLGACDLNAAANILSGWTFKRRVKLLSITSVERTAATLNSVLTMYNGANALDDTHTVTATGVGTALRTTISDANNYDLFQHDDTLRIACGGQATAGTADVIIEYMPLAYIA